MKPKTNPSLPKWAVLASIALLIVVLGYMGYKTLTGYSGEPGPRKEIAPGTYDLRAEVKKMQESKRQGEH